MGKFIEKIDRLMGRADTGLSLYTAIKGSSVMASVLALSWAVEATEVFSEYAPFSWVAAGFLGIIIWATAYLLWQVGYKIRVATAYNAKFLNTGLKINPLNKTFEDQRIFLNDFALPSHPLIEGKTFINCEIIGPANMYWNYGNRGDDTKLPIIDAVCLNPQKKFFNGFVFNNCIFRGCSFQRITLFVNPEEFATFHSNNNLNWIGITLHDVQNILTAQSQQSLPLTEPVQNDEKAANT